MRILPIIVKFNDIFSRYSRLDWLDGVELGSVPFLADDNIESCLADGFKVVGKALGKLSRGIHFKAQAEISGHAFERHEQFPGQYLLETAVFFRLHLIAGNELLCKFSVI